MKAFFRKEKMPSIPIYKFFDDSCGPKALRYYRGFPDKLNEDVSKVAEIIRKEKEGALIALAKGHDATLTKNLSESRKETRSAHAKAASVKAKLALERRVSNKTIEI